MKPFMQYLSEDYDGVSQEIHDANDHIADMVAHDEEYRKQNPKTPGHPLLYTMHVLTAIHDLYLGANHPEKYPQYAKNVKEYSNTIDKYAPHLKPYIEPHMPRDWDSGKSGTK